MLDMIFLGVLTNLYWKYLSVVLASSLWGFVSLSFFHKNQRDASRMDKHFDFSETSFWLGCFCFLGSLSTLIAVFIRQS
jgi:hypothetical protein